jgi:hypothetical protein
LNSLSIHLMNTSKCPIKFSISRILFLSVRNPSRLPHGSENVRSFSFPFQTFPPGFRFQQCFHRFRHVTSPLEQ